MGAFLFLLQVSRQLIVLTGGKKETGIPAPGQVEHRVKECVLAPG